MIVWLAVNRPLLRRLQVLLFARLVAGGDSKPASRRTFPVPALDVRPAAGKQTAVPAGGCCLGLEAVFKIFFSVAHDPTTLNRQGPDVGPDNRQARIRF